MPKKRLHKSPSWTAIEFDSDLEAEPYFLGFDPPLQEVQDEHVSPRTINTRPDENEIEKEKTNAATIIEKYIKELESKIHYASSIVEGNIEHIQEHLDIQEEFLNQPSAIEHQLPLLQDQPRGLVEKKKNENQILCVDISGNKIIQIDDKNVMDNRNIQQLENDAEPPKNQLSNLDYDTLQSLNQLVKSVNRFLKPLKGRPKKKNILLPQIKSASLNEDTIKSGVNEILVTQPTTNIDDTILEILTALQEMAGPNLVCTEKQTHINEVDRVQYSSLKEADHDIATQSIQIESQEMAAENLATDILGDADSLHYLYSEKEEEITGENIISEEHQIDTNNDKVECLDSEEEIDQAQSILIGLPENAAEIPKCQLSNPDYDPLQSLKLIVKLVNPSLKPLKGRPKKKNILLPLLQATETTDEHNPSIPHTQTDSYDLKTNNTNVPLLSLDSVDGDQQIPSASLKVVDTIKCGVNEISVTQPTTNIDDAILEILTALREMASTNLVCTEKQTDINEIGRLQYSSLEEADHDIATKSIQIDSQEMTGENLATDVLSDADSLQYLYIEKEEDITNEKLISEVHQMDTNNDKFQCLNSQEEIDQDRLILIGLLENDAETSKNQLSNPDYDPLQSLNLQVQSVNPFLEPLKERPRKENILFPLLYATETSDAQNPSIESTQSDSYDLNKNNTNFPLLSLDSVDGDQQIPSASLKVDTIKCGVNEISVTQPTTNIDDAILEILTALQEMASTNLVCTEKQTDINEIGRLQYSSLEEADHDIATKSIQIDSQEMTGENLATDVLSDADSLHYVYVEKEEDITNENLISEVHQMDTNDDKFQCLNSQEETDQDRLILIGLLDNDAEIYKNQLSNPDYDPLQSLNLQVQSLNPSLKPLKGRPKKKNILFPLLHATETTDEHIPSIPHTQTDSYDMNKNNTNVPLLSLESLDGDQQIPSASLKVDTIKCGVNEISVTQPTTNIDDAILEILTALQEMASTNLVCTEKQTDINEIGRLQYSSLEEADHDIATKSIQIDSQEMTGENVATDVLNDADSLHYVEKVEEITSGNLICKEHQIYTNNDTLHYLNYEEETDQDLEIEENQTDAIDKAASHNSYVEDDKNHLTDDNQPDLLNRNSPQYSNQKEDYQEISSKSQKVMKKNLTDEKHQIDMTDVDSLQHSKTEEKVNQGNSPTKYANVDEIESQLQEIMVENLVEYVDQVPGSQPEFELYEIIDEHLGNELQEIKSVILSSKENQADMNDEDRPEYLYAEEDQNYDIVTKSQKITNEKLVTEEDQIGMNNAHTSQVANVQEEAYQDHGIQTQPVIMTEIELREIMGEDLDEFPDEVLGVQIKSVDKNKLELELQEIMDEHLDNWSVNINDADSLQVSNNKKHADGLHDVNKVQTETIPVSGPYGEHPEPKPKDEVIELQLKEITGVLIGDQSDENLNTNSEFDLLQCLIEGKVYEIQTTNDNTFNIEDNPDDPDNPEYVDRPGEEKKTNEHSLTSTFAKIGKNPNLGEPTPQVASQQADMISRLSRNPSTSIFETTAVTQEEPLPQVIRRYRDRPKGATGKVYEIENTQDNTFNTEDDPDDPDDPDYVEEPAEDKATNENLMTSSFAGIGKNPNLGKPTSEVKSQQADIISRLRRNPPASTFETTAATQEKPLLQYMTRFRGRPKGTTGRKWAPRTQVTGHRTFLTKLHAEEEVKQIKRPFYITPVLVNPPTAPCSSKKQPTTNLHTGPNLEKTENFVPNTQDSQIPDKATVDQKIEAAKKFAIDDIFLYKNTSEESQKYQQVDIRDTDFSKDGITTKPDTNFLQGSGDLQPTKAKINIIKQEIIKPAIAVQPAINIIQHKILNTSINQLLTHSKLNSDATISDESDQLKILSPTKFKPNIMNIDELIPTGFTDQQLINPQIPTSSTANPHCLSNDENFDPKLHYVIPKIPGMNLENNYLLALAEQQKVIKALRDYNKKLLQQPPPSQPKPNTVQPVISSSPPNIVQPVISSSSPKKREKRRNYRKLIKNLSAPKPINLLDIFSEPNPKNVHQYGVKCNTVDWAKVNVLVTPKINIVPKIPEKIKHHYKVLNAGPGRSWKNPRRGDKDESSDDKDDDSNNLEKDDKTNEEISNGTQNLSDNRIENLSDNRMQALPDLTEKCTETKTPDVSAVPCDLNNKTEKASKPDVPLKKSTIFAATNLKRKPSLSIRNKRKIVSKIISRKNIKRRKIISSRVTVPKKRTPYFKVISRGRQTKIQKDNFKDEIDDKKSHQCNIEKILQSQKSSNTNEEIESAFIQPIGELPNLNDLSGESNEITDQVIGGDLVSFCKDSKNLTSEENKTEPMNTRSPNSFFNFIITSNENSDRSNSKKERPKKSSSTKELSSVKKSATSKKLSISTKSVRSKKLSNVKKSLNAKKSPDAKESPSTKESPSAKKTPNAQKSPNTKNSPNANKSSNSKILPSAKKSRSPKKISCSKKNANSPSTKKFSNVSPCSSSNSLSSLKSESSKTSPNPKVLNEVSRIDFNNFPSTTLSSSETSPENIDMELKKHVSSSKKSPSPVKLLPKSMNKIDFNNFQSPKLSSSDTSLENAEIGSKKPVPNSKISQCPEKSILKTIECNISEIDVYNYPIPTLSLSSGTSPENPNIILNKPVSREIKTTPILSPISKESPNSSSTSNTSSSTSPNYKTSLSSSQISKTSSRSSQSFKKSEKQKKTVLKAIEHNISKLDFYNYPMSTLSASETSLKNSDIKSRKSVFSEVEKPERCEEKQEQLFVQVPDYGDNDRAEEIVIPSNEMIQKIMYNYYCPPLLSPLPPTPCSSINDSFECVEIIGELVTNIEKYISDGSINEVINAEETNNFMMEEINYPESIVNEESLDLIPSHTDVSSHIVSELTDITADELKYINNTLMTAMPNVYDAALDNLTYVTEETHNTQPLATDFLTLYDNPMVQTCVQNAVITEDLGEFPVLHLTDASESDFTDLDDIPCEDLLNLQPDINEVAPSFPELDLFELDEIVHGNNTSKLIQELEDIEHEQEVEKIISDSHTTTSSKEINTKGRKANNKNPKSGNRSSNSSNNNSNSRNSSNSTNKWKIEKALSTSRSRTTSRKSSSTDSKNNSSGSFKSKSTRSSRSTRSSISIQSSRSCTKTSSTYSDKRKLDCSSSSVSESNSPISIGTSSYSSSSSKRKKSADNTSGQETVASISIKKSQISSIISNEREKMIYLSKKLVPSAQKNLYIALMHLLQTEKNSENVLNKLNRKIDKKEKKTEHKKYILNIKEQKLEYLKNKELKLLKAREILLKDEHKRLRDLEESSKKKQADKDLHQKINEDEAAEKFKEVELTFSKQFNALKDKQKKLNNDIEKIHKRLIRINYKIDVLKENVQEEKTNEVDRSSSRSNLEAYSSSDSEESVRQSTSSASKKKRPKTGLSSGKRHGKGITISHSTGKGLPNSKEVVERSPSKELATSSWKSKRAKRHTRKTSSASEPMIRSSAKISKIPLTVEINPMKLFQVRPRNITETKEIKVEDKSSVKKDVKKQNVNVTKGTERNQDNDVSKMCQFAQCQTPTSLPVKIPLSRLPDWFKNLSTPKSKNIPGTVTTGQTAEVLSQEAPKYWIPKKETITGLTSSLSSTGSSSSASFSSNSTSEDEKLEMKDAKEKSSNIYDCIKELDLSESTSDTDDLSSKQPLPIKEKVKLSPLITPPKVQRQTKSSDINELQEMSNESENMLSPSSETISKKSDTEYSTVSSALNITNFENCDFGISCSPKSLSLSVNAFGHSTPNYNYRSKSTTKSPYSKSRSSSPSSKSTPKSRSESSATKSHYLKSRNLSDSASSTSPETRTKGGPTSSSSSRFSTPLSIDYSSLKSIVELEADSEKLKHAVVADLPILEIKNIEKKIEISNDESHQTECNIFKKSLAATKRSSNETIATSRLQEKTLKARTSKIVQDTPSKESKTLKHLSREIKVNEDNLISKTSKISKDDRLSKEYKTSEYLTDNIKSKEDKAKTTQISEDDYLSKKPRTSKCLTEDIKSQKSRLRNVETSNTVNDRKEKTADKKTLLSNLKHEIEEMETEENIDDKKLAALEQKIAALRARRTEYEQIQEAPETERKRRIAERRNPVRSPIKPEVLKYDAQRNRRLTQSKQNIASRNFDWSRRGRVLSSAREGFREDRSRPHKHLSRGGSGPHDRLNKKSVHSYTDFNSREKLRARDRVRSPSPREHSRSEKRSGNTNIRKRISVSPYCRNSKKLNDKRSRDETSKNKASTTDSSLIQESHTRSKLDQGKARIVDRREQISNKRKISTLLSFSESSAPRSTSPSTDEYNPKTAKLYKTDKNVTHPKEKENPSKRPKWCKKSDSPQESKIKIKSPIQKFPKTSTTASSSQEVLSHNPETSVLTSYQEDMDSTGRGYAEQERILSKRQQEHASASRYRDDSRSSSRSRSPEETRRRRSGSSTTSANDYGDYSQPQTSSQSHYPYPQYPEPEPRYYKPCNPTATDFYNIESTHRSAYYTKQYDMMYLHMTSADSSRTEEPTQTVTPESVSTSSYATDTFAINTHDTYLTETWTSRTRLDVSHFYEQEILTPTFPPKTPSPVYSFSPGKSATSSDLSKTPIYLPDASSYPLTPEIVPSYPIIPTYLPVDRQSSIGLPTNLTSSSAENPDATESPAASTTEVCPKRSPRRHKKHR